ncbi:unnamed protein product [Malus baccata var. baccata]
MGSSTFIHKLYVMLAQSITDPRTREVLSWKEDDLSFEIKDYNGFDLLMGHWIKCKFNHPSLQRGQPNRLSQFNMITDEVPARVRERDPPTEKRRWTILLLWEECAIGALGTTVYKLFCLLMV